MPDIPEPEPDYDNRDTNGGVGAAEYDRLHSVDDDEVVTLEDLLWLEFEFEFEF